MDLFESIRISLRTIRGQPLRAALTTLGIVIGIAAVITFVTLGASLKTNIVGQFGDSQANRIFLAATPTDEGGPPALDAQAVFTEHDLDQLRQTEGVASVVPRGEIPTSSVVHDNTTIAVASVTATTQGQFVGATFAAGGPFTESQPGLVVNKDAAGQFPENLTVGDRVTITRRTGDRGPVTVTVVGILADDAGLSPFSGFSSRPSYYVSTQYYEQVIDRPATDESVRVYPLATVLSENPGEVATVKQRVRTYLERSDAQALIPPGYELSARTNEDIVRRIERVVNRLTQFVTGIAVISLVVGAIGIANIMLVSVRERTREIGIMKAVGANNRDVLQLFLVESIILGLLGALLGVPLGIAGGYVATTYAELPLTLPLVWIGIAISIGFLVGVFAGLYPAWRAARVDPIDALRYE